MSVLVPTVSYFFHEVEQHEYIFPFKIPISYFSICLLFPNKVFSNENIKAEECISELAEFIHLHL